MQILGLQRCKTMNEENVMKYEFVHKYDHYEVYVNGVFVCSADTAVEAAKELEEYMSRERYETE